MTDRELMQQALDALEKLNKDGWILADFEDEVYASIEALRARLAQPEQEPINYEEWNYDPMTGKQLWDKQPEPEPVAWMYNGNLHEFDPSDWAEGEIIPLYTAPPQREWQGLTDEDIRKLSDDCAGVRDENEFIRAIEAKLKEKNS